MSEIKIILLCGGRFAVPALQELAFFKQLAVVVIPRHCDEMIQQATGILAGLDIPIIEVDKETFVDKISTAITEYKLTAGLTMGFSYIIPERVYALPPKGFFNIHPGPLPGYRGADPVFQQIKNKEQKAGVAIHKMDSGLDTGPVVLQQMIQLETTDTHGMLTGKLAQLAAGMIRILLKLVSFDFQIPSKPQDESKKTLYKKQQAADVTINWKQMDADSIIALINACNPWNKGAVTQFDNRIIRLLTAEKIIPDNLPASTPGTIFFIGEKYMLVSTIHDEAIKVFSIYTEEGFLNAERIAVTGAVLGSCLG